MKTLFTEARERRRAFRMALADLCILPAACGVGLILIDHASTWSVVVLDILGTAAAAIALPARPLAARHGFFCLAFQLAVRLHSGLVSSASFTVLALFIFAIVSAVQATIHIAALDQTIRLATLTGASLGFSFPRLGELLRVGLQTALAFIPFP